MLMMLALGLGTHSRYCRKGRMMLMMLALGFVSQPLVLEGRADAANAGFEVGH